MIESRGNVGSYARPGRKVGLGVLVVGLVFGLVNGIAWLASHSYFPTMLASVPAAILCGLAMMLFPGADIPSSVPPERLATYLWRLAPWSHRLIWVFATLLGIAAGLAIINAAGYFQI